MPIFNPKTARLEKLAGLFPNRINELESLFDKNTIIYIDFGNIFRWSEKLKWIIDLKRLKQLLNSFSTIKSVKIYYGIDSSIQESIDWIEEVKRLNYNVITKEVKKISISINVTGTSLDSPDVLKKFINPELLSNLTIQNIEQINTRLLEINHQGINVFQKSKCNFDVEIALDMIIDAKDNNADNFILWSGDSDFTAIINKLRTLHKKIILFNTARRVSYELSQTKVYIYDIQKIKNFICRPKFIQKDVKDKIEEMEKTDEN
jgi:uncharacterized LabA/DUF88 family protein